MQRKVSKLSPYLGVSYLNDFIYVSAGVFFLFLPDRLSTINRGRYCELEVWHV